MASPSSPWWAIATLAFALGVLGVVLVLASDDDERPVPQPPDPAAPPRPISYQMRPSGRLVPVPSPLVERIERTDVAQQEFGARIATEALRRAQLLAELEAEHEILRARRERAIEDLIDRVLPDPTVPKGER